MKGIGTMQVTVQKSVRVTIYERGGVPCADCQKPHVYYDDPKHKGYRTWADPDDGHPYRPMTAKALVEFLNLGGKIVDDFKCDLRRLAND